MATTLKEKYENRKLQRLQEKLQHVDRKLIKELVDPRDALILEAFDKQQMAAALDIIKKLKSTNFGIERLDQAKATALEDVSAVLRGGGKGGLMKKLIGIFKKDKGEAKENPLTKALAFCDAMANFFEDIMPFIQELGTTRNKDDEGEVIAVDEGTTLLELITGKDDVDINALKALSMKDKNVNKKLKEFGQLVMQGMKPSDALSGLGQKWYADYLGGDKGVKQIASQMLSKSVGELKKTSATVTGNFKNVEAVGAAAANAATQGSVETTKATGGEPSAPGGEPAKAAAPGEKTVAGAGGGGGGEPGGAKPTAGKKLADDHVTAMANDFAKKAGVDKDVTLKILKALNDSEKLKG